MPQRLKYFQWLVYGTIAIQFIGALLPEKSWADLAGFAVVAIIVFVLAWAAAHEKSKYAAWLLLIFFALDTANTIGQFWGDGPSWLQHVIAPERPVTSLGMVLDALTNLLEVAALYFYFFGATRAASQP